MLSYKNRFHGHSSLKYVFKNGDTVRGRHTVLRYLENPRRRHSRVAVVVSKKVHKRAVRRNRIRRRIYEIIRLTLPDLNANHDLVVIVTSPEVDAMTAGELTDELMQSLRSAGLYKNPK